MNLPTTFALPVCFTLNLDEYSSDTYSKKQVVYAEGKRPRYLYYVKSGKVKAFKSNEDGKEYITDLYIGGDFIGYPALIEDQQL